MNSEKVPVPIGGQNIKTDETGFPVFEKDGSPDWHVPLNMAFGMTAKQSDIEAHNADPEAHGGLNFDGRYAPVEHQHKVEDIVGLPELLTEYKDKIDRLEDLMSGDMPGAIMFEANFATLENVTVRDGVWNPSRKTIEA